ncbi:MAG TPA: AgmX/PglI C-terminal domain-containing protein, partial [Anaeromyxobacter sp.]
QGAVEGGELVASQFDARKIQAVVGREQRTLAPCFRAEASRSPDFQGDVPIEFAIGNDGRVVQLWIDEPRFRKGALEACLLSALGAWRFDPFPGQRPTVSLAFRIGR